MLFVENKHLIETLPAQRAHEPLGNRIGLRCSDRCANLPNAQTADLARELCAKDAVSVTNQVRRWFAIETGIDDLLSGPRQSRMAWHTDVDDLPARVMNQEKDIERFKGQCPHTTKITRSVEAWAAWALAEADRIDPIRSGRFLDKNDN